jgi:Tol biopolymer transport system component
VVRSATRSGIRTARTSRFISSSRDHKTAWFRVADAGTGEVKTLFEETAATQVGDASLTENLWRVLPASKELIWWSQRDNWTHLYLYDLTTGKLKNRITTGDGNVEEVVRVDEKARTIYFMGQGKEAGAIRTSSTSTGSGSTARARRC